MDTVSIVCVFIHCNTVHTTVIHVESGATWGFAVPALAAVEVIDTSCEQCGAVEVVVRSTVEVEVRDVNHDDLVAQTGTDTTVVAIFSHCAAVTVAEGS